MLNVWCIDSSYMAKRIYLMKLQNQINVGIPIKNIYHYLLSPMGPISY